MLLKSKTDQNEDHILGLSTVVVAKKMKELIKKDELTIADLEGVGLQMLKRQYKNDVELKYHPRSFDKLMSKSTKPHNWFYNRDYYYLVNLSTEEKYSSSLTKHYVARYHIEGIEDMIQDKWIKKIHLYQIDALNVNVKKKWGYGFPTSIVVRRSDNKEYEFSFVNLPRLNLNNVEDMYLVKVQDKLHHIKLDFEIDFINALL
ncbi:hypothetical protein Tco_1086610 [Tanacetum coccineum]